MPVTKSEGRPHCAGCGVDMWLVRVVSNGSMAASYVFECKVCGDEVSLSAGEARECGIEDHL